MYLKRLEMNGFKTFADRTELEFGPGITAIVGPNGSGKSNISDSILWVLGEQSMKSLRGAKSTDLIFNGSDARKALGMAEVNLTLDNSSGVLPTEFTEVTVTRRIFRSGESEYLINRVPVRLRDVQSLFLDTGIGKQSYSILSQGEVDAILSANPEERRALFEEAAGINKYKHRKKETLRKLEATRLNLLRVSDIIDELETQLAPMAEQSEKARQYQALHSELTVLQLSLLVVQYTGLQGSLARSRERETELHKELETLRHTLQQTEVKEATLRAELQACEDQLEERRGVEQRAASAVQGLVNKLQLLREQEATAVKERERLLHERADWEAQQGHFDEEISAAKAEAARLQEVIAGLQAEVEAADAALQQAAFAVNEIAVKIRQCRGEYLDAMDQAARVRNELTRVESLLRTSAGRRERLMNEQQGLAGKITERKAALDAARAQVAERQAARTQLHTRRGELDAARQQAVVNQGNLRREENRLREELASLRARHGALRELEDALEGYFPGVRALLAAAGKGMVRGWFAPVADVLEVPAELETAVEVALGAGLQDVVTRSEASAREAVAFLKSSRAGRATFLPLDTLSPSPRAEVPPADGVLGIAMDLVGFDREFEVIARHHLGRVIVARDLDAALALAKSGKASGWSRIVTVDGEVVFPTRAITGGSLSKDSGLLKRKRELQELTEQVTDAEGRAAALERRVGEAAAEVKRLENEVAAVLKEAERAAAAVAEAERTVATVGRDLAALEERYTSLNDELAWLDKEMEGTRNEEAGHLEKLAAAEKTQGEAEAALAEAERSLAGGQHERDAMAECFSALRVQLTEARGKLSAAEQAAARAESLRANLGERMTRNTQAATDVETTQQGLRAQQAETQAELQRLREAYAGSTQALDAEKNRRSALLEAIAANLEEQKAHRGAIEDCQERLHRAQLRGTQVETEIGFLEGQFFDDYRLTPDQAVVRAQPVENRGIAVARLKELQAAIDELGTVNLGAIEEYERIQERLGFLTHQRRDLEESRDALLKVIAEIDQTCKEKFLEAFAAIAREFQDLFTRLFGGGETRLSLEDPSDVLESGIDIHVTIPGKRNQNLLQLSGGERALTALALLFAMLRVKPSPFVVLDEIDAPLDESNVGRYTDVLRDFCHTTQFLVVTHNRGTMEAADVLYGVTMEKAGVSKIVSVRLAEAQPQPSAS